MRELIYSKYSNERSRRFAIRTDILEENGEKIVQKCALYPEGKEHIKNLARFYTLLNQQYEKVGYQCNKCQETAAGAEFEYLTGKTLEEILDEHLKDDRQEEAKELLIEYLEKISVACGQEEFTETEEFKQVFGTFVWPEKLKGAGVMNIDLVCENLIMEEQPTVLDYEWTFEFPIPVKYVLYRIIHYYVCRNSIREALSIEALYEKFEISQELISIFEKMEEAFQAYITGQHVPMRELFSDMNPGMHWVRPNVHDLQKLNGESLQIYFSVGNGYEEGTSRLFKMQDGEVSCTTALPDGCDSIRVDPGDHSCAVRIEKMAFDGKEVSLENSAVSNGAVVGAWAYIGQDDPGISAIPVPQGARELSIRLKAFPAVPELVLRMLEMEREKLRMQEKIKAQAQLINDMKNTKVWKIYQKYRNKVERKK